MPRQVRGTTPRARRDVAVRNVRRQIQLRSRLLRRELVAAVDDRFLELREELRARAHDRSLELHLAMDDETHADAREQEDDDERAGAGEEPGLLDLLDIRRRIVVRIVGLLLGGLAREQQRQREATDDGHEAELG